MPANPLIYKSIWQGTINSFPPAGCAEGGYLSHRKGRRVPSSAHALALLNPTVFVPSTQIQPHFPHWELSQGQQPCPPQTGPLQITQTAPPARCRYTTPNTRFIGKNDINL